VDASRLEIVDKSVAVTASGSMLSTEPVNLGF
jgi:hypothetical protein